MANTFGGMIERIREKRGWSRVFAADRSEGRITRAGLYRIEKGSRFDPKLSTLVGLTRSLGVRVVVDPEGVEVEELDHPETGIVCESCGRHQLVGDRGWEDGQPQIGCYCPDHVWKEPEKEVR